LNGSSGTENTSDSKEEKHEVIIAPDIVATKAKHADAQEFPILLH
jgi:hypothetical protein